MNRLNEKNKKLIKKYSVIAIFIIIIAIITIFVIRYNVEGETNLPFKITSIKVASTATGDLQEDLKTLNITQANDFYFYIEKNENYSKEDSISKITFENFKVEKSPNVGNINVYKPSPNSILYSYTDEYKIENSLSYSGALSTNLASLEIGNQGGLIGFSIALDDIGTYVKDNSNIIYDGTLLSKLNLKLEDISMKVSFDVIIETTSHKKFKATLSFDLPTGNIIEDGKAILDNYDLDKIVFKRF